MSQAAKAIALRPEAAALLEQARAALAALGLSVEQAADLQLAECLVDDAEYLDLDDLDDLAAVATDLDLDELRDEKSEAIARAVAQLTA
jgi:antitoxin component of RelBE/YafQ-DinJ toxin-antitoxin module